jgi:hypothetical protein
MIYDGWGDDPAFEQPGHQSELEVSLEFPERRSETKGRSLRRPVGVLQPTAGDPDSGILIHEIDEGLERIRTDNRIRVQQQDVLRRIG